MLVVDSRQYVGGGIAYKLRMQGAPQAASE